MDDLGRMRICYTLRIPGSKNHCLLSMHINYIGFFLKEMTISWVMKRAELVLKCIKGFMIEFVQWGAQDSRNLQFVVPQVNTATFFPHQSHNYIYHFSHKRASSMRLSTRSAHSSRRFSVNPGPFYNSAFFYTFLVFFLIY